jgi:hypothetical protein
MARLPDERPSVHSRRSEVRRDVRILRPAPRLAIACDRHRPSGAASAWVPASTLSSWAGSRLPVASSAGSDATTAGPRDRLAASSVDPADSPAGPVD